MAFTRQQVLEMQQKLASLGYKDTDFEILAVEDIGGEEWVAVVDGGVNKRMLLGNFEQYIITKNIPDLDEIRQNAELGSTAYHMPNGGIPRADLSGDVQSSLGRADRAVQPSTLQRALNTKQDKLTFDDYPEAGSENPVKSDGIYQAIQDIDKIESISVNGNNIPKDIHGNVDIEVPDELKDLADDTDHRLVSDAEKEFWDNKYDFPSGGIPASDLAPGVIPDLSRYITKWVNDLVYYYKKNETYNRQEIDALVSGFQQYAPVVVEELPDPTADTMYHLYLAPSEDPQEENVYNEYITVDFGESANPRYEWELVGSTAIKMGDYPQRLVLERPYNFDDVKVGDIIGAEFGENWVASAVSDGAGVENPSVTFTIVDGNRIASIRFEKENGTWTAVDESLIGVEDSNNKVSSWFDIPNNDNYPSEKLVKDSLDAKQDNLIIEVGGMERSNVSGTGSITITGTRGQFPRVTKAGTYKVITKMQSSTASYGLAVTFGSNSYTLSTTNGVINDERELTLAANDAWAGSVVGAVGANTYIYISVVGEGAVTKLSSVSVSGSYNDLSDKPTIPTVPAMSTNIANDALSNNKTVTPNAVANYAPQYLTNGAKKIWTGTQAQYDLLTPANDTLYFIPIEYGD